MYRFYPFRLFWTGMFLHFSKMFCTLYSKHLQPIMIDINVYIVVCGPKRHHIIFWINSQKWTYLNNFWYTGSNKFDTNDHSFVYLYLNSVIALPLCWVGTLYQIVLWVLSLKQHLHDTTGCQIGCQTGLTTGLTTVLNEQLFVQSVIKPGCTTGLTTGCIV